MSFPLSIGRSFNAKSKAAILREQEAIACFDEHRIDTASRLEQQGFPTNAVIATTLLPPNHHLTAACWQTFRKHVDSFPGWKAKRREATPEEKLASKEKRKGKVYWIETTFDSTKMAHDIAAQHAALAQLTGTTAFVDVTKRPANEDAEAIEQPAAKKTKVLNDISNAEQDDGATRITP
jgi:hypothetical protein